MDVGADIFKHGFNGAPVNVMGHKRLRFIYGCFVLAFIWFAARTIQLGIQGTDRPRQALSDDAWTVSRADIVDRNGDILAKNIMSWRVVMRPRQVDDRDAVANLIHQVFPLEFSVSDVLKKMDSGRKYIVLKEHATDSQRSAIMGAKLAGLDTEPVQDRKYPKRRLFSHIVGFVGSEGRGMEGAERIYNEYLTQNSDPLQLSLDSRIQAVMYEQLSLAVEHYQAKGAMGMLMNSRTGEMLAMVNLPDFDPEKRDADPESNRMFMPLRGVFEMGSVFKVFNTAMAFENGINKEYFVVKPFKILDRRGKVAASIGDVANFKPPRPNLNVEEIMLYSCNAGSAQIALDLPDGAQKEFFHRVHLDEPLDSEFGRTARPLMPAKWGPVERATVAMGHGISVTPLQLMLAINAMTNGGVYVYPTWQKRGVGVVRGERVLDANISARLRGIMVRIAEETTARKARVAGITIGGKTGTAEKRDAHGKIDKKSNRTTFVGIFPAEAPQYIIMVVLDEPKGVKESFGLRTAAWNAVPTAGKILDSSLPLLFE